MSILYIYILDERLATDFAQNL